MSQFKKLRAVTLPVLKMKKNEERFFLILAAMFEGKKIDDQKGPATLTRAVDLESGEYGVLICPTVMSKELSENYPNGGYVGKAFSVVLSNVPEKRYNIVTLSEVALPDDMSDKLKSVIADARAQEAEQAKAPADAKGKAK